MKAEIARPVVKTSKAVAEVFGVSDRTVASWWENGAPRKETSPRHFEYDCQAIQDWLVERDRPSQQATPETVMQELSAERLQERVRNAKDTIAWIKGNMSDVLRGSQVKSLEALDMAVDRLQTLIPEAKAAELSRIVLALNAHFGTMFDKMRLVEGDSTENVAVIVKYEEDLKNRLGWDQVNR